MKASTATEVSGVKGCLIIFPSRPIYVAFLLVIVFESSEYLLHRFWNVAILIYYEIIVTFSLLLKKVLSGM